MKLATVWWLFFWTATGLCIGSFLNAVIYRLPRDRSLRDPLWSFCPHCEHRIRWYDNLPVLSFILLGGRCRDCREPIATRYVVVEIGMALVALVLLDAFFVGHVRAGFSESVFGIGDRLATDWPMYIAHLVLFACLISMSAIDLEHYWVDIRVTHFATLVGLLMHILWTPDHSRIEAIRPFDTTAVVSVGALVGLTVVWLIRYCHSENDADDLGDSSPEFGLPDEPQELTEAPAVAPSHSRASGWVAGLVLIALIVAVFLAETQSKTVGHWARALIPMAFLFMLIVRESTVARDADAEIVQTLEDERGTARNAVLSEFGMLVPAIVLALAGWWAMRSSGVLAASVHSSLDGGVRIWDLALLRHWSPLLGFATAATGFVIGGALGWVIRIVFTLVFGKEAFGTGDIHLMAAAGCVAGWPVVVLGFFLTCGLALLGWVLALPFKRSRALPLGPWLSLSFLIVVVFYDVILTWPIVARLITVAEVLFLGNSQV